jgi:hypothetical protein
VIVRDFTEKLTEEPALEEFKLSPPIEPLVLTFVQGLLGTTAGTVVGVGAFIEGAVVVGRVVGLLSDAIFTASDSA